MKAFLTVLLISSFSLAEDINKIFTKVNEFVAERQYSKALRELSWAEKELQKLHSARLQEFLPESLAGLTGGKPESSSALGFMSTERTYSSGGSKVKVSILGGSSAVTSGLAGLGAMAAAFGAMDPAVETLRIDGRTATLRKDNIPELTVTLDGGAMVKLEGLEGESDLKAIAGALNLEEIEKYLKG
jgi:hypothetical protein